MIRLNLWSQLKNGKKEHHIDRRILKNNKLGEILLERKVINIQQLEEALKIQKQNNKHLGEILYEQGYAQEKNIVVALVIQCNLPYIAIDQYDIDPRIIQLIEPETAVKYKIVPLDLVGHVLSVVMIDPLNLDVHEILERKTGFSIAPFVATGSEVEKAINRYYK